MSLIINKIKEKEKIKVWGNGWYGDRPIGNTSGLGSAENPPGKKSASVKVKKQGLGSAENPPGKNSPSVKV